VNIYEMYGANGDRAGFYVRRDSWGPDSVARVNTIDDLYSGPLPGPPPYHGNLVVQATFYVFGKAVNEFELSCPGTSAYKRVSGP
jgi:hypothetical protein